MTKNIELYGVVQFINGNPILDGMLYFENRKDALSYAVKLGNCNVIRLCPAEITTEDD